VGLVWRDPPCHASVLRLASLAWKGRRYGMAKPSPNTLCPCTSGQSALKRRRIMRRATCPSEVS